jgi:hypothetical protein
MSGRTSQKEVRQVFARFLHVFGLRAAESYNDVGGFLLDHASMYGGYQIEQIVSEGGGVTHPFGDSRMQAGAFVDCLRFAMAAHRHAARTP